MTAVSLTPRRRSRRPSLTPMIDVVFLLLVFFMLAARFGTDLALETRLGGGGGDGYSGPPRLISVTGEKLQLNGFPIQLDQLATNLQLLMSDPSDVIILRPREGATTQALVDVIAALRAAGLTSVAIVD